MEFDAIKQLVERHDVGELLTGRVLVVDDDEPNCDVVAGVLEPDYEVLQATSGEEALQILSENELDIIIADQRMPGMTGTGMLERARKEHPDIIGIILTAYTDTPAIIGAINRAGVFQFLTKPWDADHLHLVVDEASRIVYQRRAIPRLVELLSRRNLELASAMDELRAAQQQMIHMERLGTIGRLTAGITHELRNLLTGLSLLRVDFADADVSDDLAETVDVVVAGVKNLMGTLQAMQQFARDGQLDISAEMVSPVDVLRDALTVMRMDMGFRRREVVQHIDQNLQPFMCDRRRMTQVLVNLLRNAVQATDPGGNLVIEAAPTDDGRTLLAVSDDGSGIAQELEDRIFEPFVTSKGAEGMGMGLYMARLIVESHGGRIDYAGRPEGGARFEIIL